MEFSWEFLVTALVLILVVRSHRTVIYYLKFNYYYGALNVINTLLIPFLATRPKNISNFLVQSACFRHVSKVIGVTWTLRGAEILNQEKSFVIVANHQNSLDVLGMMYIWPVIRKMTAIAKRELLFTGAFGFSMFLSGLTFIDRKSGVKAAQAINETMKDLKNKRVKLWIFPEGTRRNNGEIHQFKKGAFHTAIQAQVPIVPVVFSAYNLFLNTEKKIFNKGEVIITALPEISTKGLTSNDVDELLNRTRKAMMEVFNKTTKELQAKQISAEED